MKIGYACINMTLSDVPKKQRVSTNRTMIKRTFKEKGVKYASQLALANVSDLGRILKWNEENGIKFFRMSSDFFPWASEYDLWQLPDYHHIKYLLHVAGDFARANDHRLTFHPGPFNVLGSPKDGVVENTIKELNHHSEIFDMMGYKEATPYNKINIHVGGTYGGDFEGTAKRWCENYRKLHPRCQQRLTLENDDKPSMWSTLEIYNRIHKVVGVPIVFDYHHHRFCTGGQTEEEALKLAVSTWPAGITPVVHLSESRAKEHGDKKIRPQAHSDWIKNPVDTHGQSFDMMLECKKKELALLEYRRIVNESAARGCSVV